MDDVSVPDSPDEFFTQVIPAQLADVAEGVEEGPGAICCDILGEGQWSLTIENGKLAVAAGRSDATVVQVTVEGSEWQRAARWLLEGGTGPLNALTGGGGLAQLLARPQIASTLQAARGTLKFTTVLDGGERWAAVTFGGVEPDLDSPRTTVSMSRDDARAFARGEANPQELFMSGKIQIAGDMMLLMQLAPAMM